MLGQFNLVRKCLKRTLSLPHTCLEHCTRNVFQMCVKHAPNCALNTPQACLKRGSNVPSTWNVPQACCTSNMTCLTWRTSNVTCLRRDVLKTSRFRRVIFQERHVLGTPRLRHFMIQSFHIWSTSRAAKDTSLKVASKVSQTCRKQRAPDILQACPSRASNVLYL